MSEIIPSVACYSIVLVFCLILIKRKNRSHFDFFDPAFLFLLFTSLTFLPLSIIIILGYEVGDLFPILNIVDLDLYIKTVNAHTLLIASFTIGYFLLARRRDESDYPEVSRICYSKTWIEIGLFFIVLGYVIRPLNPSGLIRYPYVVILLMREASEIIVIGVILCHFNTKKKLIICVFVFGILHMLLSNIDFSHSNISEINRGRTFIILLGAIAFADIVKWKRRFFNVKLFGILTIIALAGLSGAELFENVVISKDPVPSPTEVSLDIALAFEPMIFENAATIISWVDDGYAKVQAGRTYLLALEGFKPFGHKYPSLAEWYVWERDPIYARDGGGYCFSAVAEGYLNRKFFGVMIHGLLLSIVAALIRYIKFCRFLGVYRPFFYAPVALRIFLFNRSEMKGVIGSTELALGSALCIVIVYHILVWSAITGDRDLKYALWNWERIPRF